MKPNFNLKFDVFSNTFYLWIGILKTCIHLSKMTLFLRKSKSESQKENNQAIKGMPQNFSGSSDDDMQCPRMCSRCRQESIYIWKYISFKLNSASLYRVVCLGIYLYFSFMETTCWIKQSHVFKWLVSALVYAGL